jgi:hypothetical protein
MAKVVASITTSVDGYVAGPGKGLGEGGCCTTGRSCRGSRTPSSARSRRRLDLEHLGVRQSNYATFIEYRVRR